MAKKLVYGNLKMTDSGEIADQLTRGLATAKIPADVEVVVFPSATDLHIVEERLKLGHPVMLGGQTCGIHQEGAHTGDVSPKRLKELGCQYVLAGHSERRIGCGESNERVKKSAEAAIEAGLTPVICIGEAKEDRNDPDNPKRYMDVVKAQLNESIPDARYNGKYKIAYEPIWAIGQDPAKPKEIEEMHKMIKNELPSALDGSKPDVLYGGAVTEKIAGPILSMDCVDGVLVGGASKKLETFLPIIHAAEKAAKLALGNGLGK